MDLGDVREARWVKPESWSVGLLTGLRTGMEAREGLNVSEGRLEDPCDPVSKQRSSPGGLASRGSG